MVDWPPHWDYMELDDEMIQQMQSGGNREQDAQMSYSQTLASNSCWDCQAFISQASPTQGSSGSKEDMNGDQKDLENEGNPENAPNRVKALFALIKGNKILHGAALHWSHHPAYAMGLYPKPIKSNKDEIEAAA